MFSEFETPSEKDVIEWVTKCWLDRYFEMKLLSKTVQIPNIIASYTDMPFHGKGGVSSTTESNALKKITAEEWIQTFHEALKQLPKIHQEIIEKVYLERKQDPVVYGEMHIGRSFYYYRKKEALHWLGLALWDKRENSD